MAHLAVGSEERSAAVLLASVHQTRLAVFVNGKPVKETRAPCSLRVSHPFHYADLKKVVARKLIFLTIDDSLFQRTIVACHKEMCV